MGTEIKLFDVVRSYDFPDTKDDQSRPPCYVEGVVIGFKDVEGCKRYVIRCTRRVFGGKDYQDEIGSDFFVPVNGTKRTFGGVCNAVEKIAA